MIQMQKTDISTLQRWCDERLNTAATEDYCPNGLQVEGTREIGRLVSGVTASEALIDAAIENNADALLVHHGYFWKGEPQPIVGMKGRRIRKLVKHGISLFAYHLPLDIHPTLGNNAQLGKRLGFTAPAPATEDGLLWSATLENPVNAEFIDKIITGAVDRSPLHIPGGPEAISSVGWCTGGAQQYIDKAAAMGLDAFISGEISEHTVHSARELGIHYFAAGHHATERYGVQALGKEIAAHFGIETQFVEIDNPV